VKEGRGVLCTRKMTSFEMVVMAPPSTSKSPTSVYRVQVGYVTAMTKVGFYILGFRF